MGKVPRPKPARLPEKLREIRVALNLSQSEMLRALGLAESSYRSAVSGWEIGTREVPLPILLTYSRLAGVSTDILIDDALELPEKILRPKH
jgi:transcriptional regulator with XRE-family HTH domain